MALIMRLSNNFNNKISRLNYLASNILLNYTILQKFQFIFIINEWILLFLIFNNYSYKKGKNAFTLTVDEKMENCERKKQIALNFI